ncbi:hypothetical protein B0I35DRAFT_484193 [Stachybotrys elegans]|uniref:Uncharacterized protein n=1 Tax=Stachybotrys elegans TaxID=80388 RepID=A0A8K0WLT2_9HYPO|nr:hypothetical protein B0I35DRAFT_484193 [Stachybotrys elegans]
MTYESDSSDPSYWASDASKSYDFDTTGDTLVNTSDLFEEPEPEEPEAEEIVSASRRWLPPQWFWLLLLACLLFDMLRDGLSGTNAVVLQKLDVLDEFVQLMQEPAELGLSVVTYYGTLADSMHTLGVVLEDYDGLLFDFCIPTSEAYARRNQYHLTYKYHYNHPPPSCETCPFGDGKGIFEPIKAAREALVQLESTVRALASDFHGTQSHLVTKLTADALLLREHVYRSQQYLEKDEADTIAKSTGIPILAILSTRLEALLGELRPACQHLGAFLDRVWQEVRVYETFVAHCERCIIPAAQHLQYHMELGESSSSKWWRPAKAANWINRPQQPYDEARDFLDFGLLPPIVKFERAVSDLEKSYKQCVGGDDSLIHRYEQMLHKSKQFLPQPPRPRSRLAVLLEGLIPALKYRLFLPAEQPDQTWLDRKLGVQWCVPAADEVLEALLALQKWASISQEQSEREVSHMLGRAQDWARDSLKRAHLAWWWQKQTIKKIAEKSWESPSLDEVGPF